jgi:hypothetical protein
MPEPARPCGGVAPPPHPGRREGGRGMPGDAEGAAREAAGRSSSGLRPSCGSRPGRP